MKASRWVLAMAVAAFAAMPSLAWARVDLRGTLEQGAVIVGDVEPGAKVSLDGKSVMVSPDGLFVMGFGRDAGSKAILKVTHADGRTETRSLAIAKRDYEIQRINGVARKYVTPPPDVLKRIARERKLKAAARPDDTPDAYFAEKFEWPAKGVISGVYGSQRIFNGKPRRPHFGVDVAAPTGTPIVAPADGIVTLAQPDMFYEGGLVFLDHGHGLIGYFMHMSKIDVKTGEHVKRGQKIGEIGQTGRATGPHVHWGMTWQGTYVDPATLVGPMPK